MDHQNLKRYNSAPGGYNHGEAEIFDLISNGHSSTPEIEDFDSTSSSDSNNVSSTRHHTSNKPEFSVNCAQLPLLCAAMYNEYDIDNIFLDRQFTREELSYYATALLWIRLLVIKFAQGKSRLTETEWQILEAVRNVQFHIPKPLQMYLSCLGSLECISVSEGESCEIFLEIPPLPVSVVNGDSQFGGYHAQTVTEESHNLFEELPCLGIAGDMLMALVSGGESNPVARITVPAGSAIQWRCMAGFVGPIPPCRPEIRQRLIRYGITSTTFEEDITGTRFNLPYLCSISDFIQKQSTFTYEVWWEPYNVNGSRFQVMNTRPCCQAETKIWTNRTVQSTVSFSTSAGIMWVPNVPHEISACAFGFQLYKEDGPGDERMDRVANWSCLKADESVHAPEQWVMPNTWYDNRNARRDLPEEVKMIERCNHVKMQQNIQRCKFVKMFAKSR